MKIPLQLDDAALTCPITGTTIKDPVVDPEGNSYEKAAIIEWLAKNETSPITRNRLRVEQLTPNRALKALLGSEERVDVDTTPSVPSFSVSTKIVSDDEGHSLIQISTTDDASTSHLPATIICVIDVSYSMGDAAVMHGDREGSAGLSLLDIVKHATRTVIETLSPQDRLGVVAYSNKGTIVFPLTYMTNENKTKAWEAVNNLEPCGGTNLWDGLSTALSLAKLESEHTNIVLLTDGMPNIHPPRGELETYVRYMDKNPDLKVAISTFGFGYSLQSKLLLDIATEGRGHYCFIPDSSFVGTVFVNATANILSTALPVTTLSVETAMEMENLSGLPSTETSWGMSIRLPPMIYGQTKDVLLRTKGKEKLTVTLKNAAGEIVSTNEPTITAAQASIDIQTAKTRAKVVHFIMSRHEKLTIDKSEAVYDSIQTDLRSLGKLFGGNVSEAIQTDVQGQIQEAFGDNESYNRWGRHYTLSLGRAYVLQQCTNFKDPGVQIYATEKFTLIRDESEEQFCKLPPPEPSRKQSGNSNYVPVQSMSTYYDASGPCFAGGPVNLRDGSTIDISELRAGDFVESSDGYVRVKCIVKTSCTTAGRRELVELDGGVLVTPWHPVRENGATKWSFPADLTPSAEHDCEAVYSFVLEGGSSVKIGSYDGIALGHGITNDPIASHPYLGSQKVVADLSWMVGWSEGFVNLSDDPCVRNAKTRLIVGLQQKEGRVVTQ